MFYGGGIFTDIHLHQIYGPVLKVNIPAPWFAYEFEGQLFGGILTPEKHILQPVGIMKFHMPGQIKLMFHSPPTINYSYTML